MKELLKIVLKLIIFLLIVAVVFYITYLKQWPWWVGASITAGIVGLYIFYIILRKIIIRKKEKSFIKNVAKEIKKQPEIEEIEKEWNEYFSILKSSGKSVYDLPWVVILGKSGSGKTSLVKYSGLSLPLTPISRSEKIYSTKHCDWWFFEEAVILDTAGRYSVAEDMEVDEEEWKELLNLLSKTREKEPVNAIVCVVSAEKLSDSNELEIEAENLKARISDLMKTLGVNIPVFIMITKMDVIGGFVKFFEHYKEHFNEVMGYINEDNHTYQKAMLEAKELLNERILNLFKQMDHISYKESAFLKEFEYIWENIENFTQKLFSPDSFTKQPMFKGIYFSSALQKECEYNFFKQFSLDVREKINKNYSIFIKDFFKNILPSQRGVYQIIKKYIEKRFKYKKLAFFAVVSILVAILGIGTFSFYQEYNLIKSIKTIKPTPKNSLNENILALNDFKTEIEEYEYNKEQLLFHLFGYDEKIEKKLKDNFVIFFNNYVFNVIKKDLSNNLNKIAYINDYAIINDYMGFLVDTILSLKQKINSGSVEFSKYFKNFVKNFIIVEENISPDVAHIFANEYLSYLKWDNNHVELVNNLHFFQNILDDIINSKPSLKWLTDKSVSLLDPITLSTFWDLNINKNVKIEGAFTKKGRENMQISINQLLESVKDRNSFNEKLNKFWIWYENEFFKQWFNFAKKFDIKDYVIKNDSLLVLATINMSTINNPYYNFLKKAAFEIENYKVKFNWNKLILKFNDIQNLAQSLKTKNSYVEILEKEKDKIIEAFKNRFNKEITDLDIKRAVLFNKYIANLNKFSNISDSKICFNLVKNLYENNQNKSELSELYYSFEAFKELMPKYADSEVIWNIIKGPVDFIFETAFYKTSQEINNLWNQKVLSNLSNYSVEELYGPNGYVRMFLNNNIGMFLEKKEFGFVPKKMFGFKVNFTDEFLNFLNNLSKKYANKKSVYNVKIQTYPIEINKNALIKPFKTRLELRCNTKNYVLDNYNFKEEAVFKYTQNCSETNLYIYFDTFVIKKRFNNFVEFLKSFKGNTLILTPKDFKTNLKAYKIKWIKLQYKIDDDGLLYYSKKLKVPEKIAK
ncbi:type VI secretion protein IcmF/TssM N-terminal domain-containing protein [Nautilia lithotrophica]